MKTAFIIHGTGGNPEENWFPWMKKKLEELWYMVFVPQFPTPEWQSLESWTEVFKELKKYINTETIFIAHSSGPAFVLSILEKINIKIEKCFFVSGFLELLQIPEFYILNETITSRQFDWEAIYKNCNYFYMCHGSDDPYVWIESVEIMSEKLWIKVDMIEWWGHLNEETGYTKFQYLLDKITKDIKI